jgi:hypothetical protein
VHVRRYQSFVTVYHGTVWKPSKLLEIQLLIFCEILLEFNAEPRFRKRKS